MRNLIELRALRARMTMCCALTYTTAICAQSAINLAQFSQQVEISSVKKINAQRTCEPISRSINFRVTSCKGCEKTFCFLRLIVNGWYPAPRRAYWHGKNAKVRCARKTTNWTRIKYQHDISCRFCAANHTELSFVVVAIKRTSCMWDFRSQSKNADYYINTVNYELRSRFLRNIMQVDDAKKNQKQPSRSGRANST